MKTIPKSFITWFLGLFNVGIYSVSDGIDSLIIKLKLAGLTRHADLITHLSETAEYQQDVIIMLDGLKCACMIITLVVLVVTNQAEIKSTCQWFKTLFFRLFSFLWSPFKKLILFFSKIL
jgi:hypothetical protein